MIYEPIPPGMVIRKWWSLQSGISAIVCLLSDFHPRASFAPRIPPGQLWAPPELQIPRENPAGADTTLPQLWLNPLPCQGLDPAGQSSTCECPGKGEAICHLPALECHSHSSRAWRGFVCTYIPLGHVQHLLWIPSPPLKIPVPYS